MLNTVTYSFGTGNSCVIPLANQFSSIPILKINQKLVDWINQRSGINIIKVKQVNKIYNNEWGPQLLITIEFQQDSDETDFLINWQ